MERSPIPGNLAADRNRLQLYENAERPTKFRGKQPLQTSLLTHLPQGKIMVKTVGGPKSDLLPGIRPKDTPVPVRPAWMFIAISWCKPSMLRQNPLQPPRPFAPMSEPALGRLGLHAVGRPGGDVGASHPSAEDFDATGILRGIDPSESRYWWMPELSSSSIVPAEPLQAGRLSQSS